ncbi:hypothetical protein SAMN02910368_02582 [Lachnospiraceae bacterium G11]|nr:hypothetical protein SAMN02910368_02582 [Lachnospiraceae bacterium G11]
MKGKKQITDEQKKLDVDLWIIALATLVAYAVYAIIGSILLTFCKDSSISVWSRLLAASLMQFGIAGWGITMVLFWRRKSFSGFGLRRENSLKAIGGTLLCFAPYIIYIVASGQFEGYEPLSIMITPDLHKAGIFTTIIGTLIIAVFWGFFEGFNYAVISKIIDRRYPVNSKLFSWGTLVCTLMGILFHPMSFDLLGIIELITTFIALYGMLIICKETKNAWGCVFAFLFIWNAI